MIASLPGPNEFWDMIIVELASILEPPLTTVSTPKYELGKKAVEILLDHLPGKRRNTLREVVVKPKLIVRKSK